MFVLGLISGVVIGMGVRVLYNMVSGKDIPLFKYPTTTYPDGTYEIHDEEMKKGQRDEEANNSR